MTDKNNTDNGSIFEKCIKYIRKLDKNKFKKLRKDSNAMLGEDTIIVVPEDDALKQKAIERSYKL